MSNKQGYFLTFSASDSSWLNKSGGFLILFSWLSFSESISISTLLNLSFKELYVDFFRFFKKHAVENYLRLEKSLILDVIFVLKSNFFDSKTAITERWNNDKTTIRMIWRYLMIFTLTIFNNYPSHALR